MLTRFGRFVPSIPPPLRSWRDMYLTHYGVERKARHVIGRLLFDQSWRESWRKSTHAELFMRTYSRPQKYQKLMKKWTTTYDQLPGGLYEQTLEKYSRILVNFWEFHRRMNNPYDCDIDSAYLIACLYYLEHEHPFGIDPDIDTFISQSDPFLKKHLPHGKSRVILAFNVKPYAFEKAQQYLLFWLNFSFTSPLVKPEVLQNQLLYG